MERQTKKQKTNDTRETLENILQQITSVHHQLKELLKKNTIKELTVLAQIGEEIKSLEKTRIEAIKSKPCDWGPLMQLNDSHWLKFFAIKDWTAFALCSKTMAALLSPIISTKFVFKQTYFQFRHYSPIKLAHVSHLHLPDNVTHIDFDHDFNKPVFHLPPAVTHIRFGIKFDSEIKNLPPTVISMDFQSPLSGKMPIEFPPALTNLSIAFRKMPKIILPPTLTHLTWFNFCPIDIISELPNLKTLDLRGTLFPLKNLRSPLESLTIFECHDDQSLENLPPTLKKLTIRENFNKPIDHLPPSLTCLTIFTHFDQPINNLPPSLTALKLGGEFNHPVDNLPPALTKLNLESSFNHPINNLPAKITHLTLGKQFNHPINSLPPAITKLIISGSFNQPLTNLPPTLTHLTLPSESTHAIHNPPSTLTHLTLEGEEWKSPAKFPPKITHLHLENCFDAPIKSLPPHLTCLKLWCDNYRNLSSLTNLPKTLKNFQISTNKVQNFDPVLGHGGATLIELPEIQYFSLSTVEPRTKIHVLAGDKIKKFSYELARFDDEDEEGATAFRFVVDFDKHEVSIISSLNAHF